MMPFSPRSHVFKTDKLLPTATIYGMIGGIPETFGGRTGVCLQRANALAELDGRDIEILTLSPANVVGSPSRSPVIM